MASVSNAFSNVYLLSFTCSILTGCFVCEGRKQIYFAFLASNRSSTFILEFRVFLADLRHRPGFCDVDRALAVSKLTALPRILCQAISFTLHD